MSDKDYFKEFNNIEENNGDSRKERYLKNENQEKQYKAEDMQKYIEDHLKIFEDLLDQIDKGIDELNSYERTMQIKRSIDRLIETLYSQAAYEDIDMELETTKYSSEKSDSITRIKEKKKNRTIEEMLSNILAQQQKEKDLVSAKTNVHKAKEQVKSSIKEVLFSVIAHRMDPKRRAGETVDSNKKQAHIYGREAIGGVLGALLKTFLTAVSAVVHEIVKPLKYTGKQETSFTKQIEESRNTDLQKGKSI